MLGLAIGSFFIFAAILAICVIFHTFGLVRMALRQLQQERDTAIREWSITTALRPERRDARASPSRTINRTTQSRTVAARALAKAVPEGH